MTKTTPLTYLVPNDIPREPERPILPEPEWQRAARLGIAAGMLRTPAERATKDAEYERHRRAAEAAYQPLIDEAAKRIAPDLPSPRLTYATVEDIRESLSPEARAAVDEFSRLLREYVVLAEGAEVEYLEAGLVALCEPCGAAVRANATTGRASTLCEACSAALAARERPTITLPGYVDRIEAIIAYGDAPPPDAATIYHDERAR